MSNYHKHKKNNIAETIIITLGKGLWFLVSWPFKKIFGIGGKGIKLNKEINIKKWQEIENLFQSKDEIHAKHAVVEADKFFDSMLRLKGGKGESFADRLRSLEDHLSKDNYQLIWQAHKLRNQISHESNFHASVRECQSAISKYKNGLINLGAI